MPPKTNSDLLPPSKNTGTILDDLQTGDRLSLFHNNPQFRLQRLWKIFIYSNLDG
jgi:hypothetical protein